MQIAEMSMAEIEARSLEIKAELETASEERLAELTIEAQQIEARKKELAEAEERKATAKAIENGEANVTTIEERKEDNKMKDIHEYRDSAEYVKAYAEYVKTGDDAQVRSLLTQNVGEGTIAVPTIVVSAIQTAWDNEPILAAVKKTYLKGNVKIGFEISATGAVEHIEGSEAVTEEDLVLGIAELKPVSIKKWISISDEVLDLAGEAFLQYIYSEIGYQIAKKLADEIVADITAATVAGSASVPAVAAISAAPGLATIASAVANLSDEASNPVIIMNKLTYANFKAVQAGANYGQDVFDGLKVLFNNTLPAYDAASVGNIYAIVGDLGRGEMVNFPNGEDITFKFDDKTLMTADLVKVLGRMYAGHGVVAPKSFTQIKKPTAQG